MTIGGWRSWFDSTWLAATLIGMVVVLTLTHIPQDALPQALQRNTLDKVEHVVAYGLVAAFFALSLKRPVRLLPLLGGLAILAAIAALDEVTQPLVNRQAAIGDYVADLIGIAVACAGVLLIRKCGSLYASRGTRVEIRVLKGGQCGKAES